MAVNLFFILINMRKNRVATQGVTKNRGWLFMVVSVHKSLRHRRRGNANLIITCEGFHKRLDEKVSGAHVGGEGRAARAPIKEVRIFLTAHFSEVSLMYSLG
jgi:hypothetical protein